MVARQPLRNLFANLGPVFILSLGVEDPLARIGKNYAPQCTEMYQPRAGSVAVNSDSLP
jgi:hypothetical protein